jgi:photosystem II stability/assembly factor-like uncharacterized protein
MKNALAVWLLVLSLTSTRIALAQSGWFWQNPSPQGNLLLAASVRGQTAVAVGDTGTIVRSTDGGASWTPQVSGTVYILDALSMVDADTAFAGGYCTDTASCPGILFRTDDGGATWTFQRQWSGHVLALFFVDPNIGWIATRQSSGSIFRTTDGAVTWTQQTIPTSVISALFFVDALPGVGRWRLRENSSYRQWGRELDVAIQRHERTAQWNLICRRRQRDRCGVGRDHPPHHRRWR